MKLNRFALTLYLVFPTIGSLSSVFMIAHFVLWVDDGITTAHSYSDALIYVGMAANEIALFGDTHITWRFIVPGLIGFFGNVFGVTEPEGLGIAMGSLNFIILLLAFGMLLRFTFHNEAINAFTISLPAWCIALMPAYWRGAFLPMLEPAAMLIYGIVLVSLWYRKLIPLFLALLIGVWVKEMVLLSVLLVPAFHYARNEVDWKQYLPFIAAGLMYLWVVAYFGNTSGNYMMNPSGWLSDWGANISEFSFWGLRYILSGFGLGLFFIIWRMKTEPGQRIHYAALAVMVTTFFIFLLFTPSNTPRLMFMIMPVLFLFNQSDESLGKSNEKLVFQE